TVTVEAQPARTQDLFHTNGNSAFWYYADFSAYGDRVNRARFGRQVECTRAQGGKIFERDFLSGLRRLVKGYMAVDAESSEAGVHAASRINELLNRLRLQWIGKHSMLRGWRNTDIEQVIELAVHVTAKAQRMVQREPAVRIVEILIHVDEDDIPAGHPFLV